MQNEAINQNRTTSGHGYAARRAAHWSGMCNERVSEHVAALPGIFQRASGHDGSTTQSGHHAAAAIRALQAVAL